MGDIAPPLSRLPCFHPMSQTPRELHSRTFLAATRLVNTTIGALHKSHVDNLLHVLARLQPASTLGTLPEDVDNDTKIMTFASRAVLFVLNLAESLLDEDKSAANSRRKHGVALLDLAVRLLNVASRGNARRNSSRHTTAADDASHPSNQNHNSGA